MMRLCFMIIVPLPIIIYYIMRVRLIERFHSSLPEAQRYQMASRCVRIAMRTGRIKTVSTGLENLPKEGGYVMYSNHQGKFDTLGIMRSHPNPCTVLIDAKRSKLPIVNSFINLIEGKRLNKADMRSQLQTVLQIVEEVKSGRRYIIYPEGGYDNNENSLQEFLPGAFKCAMKAHAPIVPVAIVDSYKVFSTNSLRRITTQVHFLKPINYEEYAGLTTLQIAEKVKNAIQLKLQECKI